MAFHFEPRADSSDEEDIDLAAWQSWAKSNVKPSRQPVPVAAMRKSENGATNAVLRSAEQAPGPPASLREEIDAIEPGIDNANVLNGSNQQEEVELTAAADDSAASKRRSGGGQKRKRKSPGVPSPGFTAVNKPAPAPARSSQQGPALNDPGDGSGVVVIPSTYRDSHDGILDFTKGRDIVRKILGELYDEDGRVLYEVEFEDRHVEKVLFDELLKHKNGRSAINTFQSVSSRDSTPEASLPLRSNMSSTRPGRRTTQRVGFVSTFDAVPVSEDELSKGESRLGRKRKAHRQAQYVDEPESDEDEPSESNDDDGPRTRLRGRKQPVQRRSTRSSRRQTHSDEEDILNADEDDDDSGFLESDLRGVKRLRTTLRLSGSSDREFSRNKSSSKINGRSEKASERQSDRSTRHKGDMVEVGENEIYRSSSDDATRAPAKPRVIAVREQFKALPRNDDFRMRHIQECETCGQGANFAQLIYCQGCTLAYHKSCMGNRNSREHLVTKIGDGDSVLQCRRCIGYPRKKDPSAPDQGRCVDCHEHGAACPPFRSRKTTVQEQKEREDNNGEDPAYPVDPARINQADNVLFRCISCWRAFHFEHLPSRSNMIDIEVDAEQRFREYKSDWHCKECLDMPAKVSGLIAWKPMDEEAYDDGLAFDQIEEDEKAYLVRWTGMSYFRACWMPGAWVWGVTAASMRKAFAKREDSQHPVKRTEDAIPEDYLRADIVLDIKYTSYVDVRTAEVDKARVREVAQALIKYKGLRYEDAVWEAPPSIEDGERWADFVVAYNDWVMGRYVHPVKVSTLRSRLDRARTNDFAKLEKKTQPDNVEGGELLNYQIEGLNWLYYKWFTQKNAILADEMGLGKTIQIIGFLATLVADWNCFPFLVVVPNSTCPNWRREIKRWAPSLRVVAYYGSRESRDLAYRYELFPETSKELRCHVVVTSYDAASDESCRKFFRSVTWQGLIVDEGQRLKNDKNLLYTALGALKAPFRILLTGTPLQNNQRELFNLLHFLDDSYNAAQLEEEYAELDTAKIGRLHEMIRPFFLRRTKAQVLTFLPPMAQIILPVSMTLVQKKVYRTILANNPTLMKAIFSADAALNRSDRASLSNILMQLRKCLCHPFVYSKGIEERNVSYAVSHRNLVDASSKLKLLEILLPKLKERGHRVLIFSQFLDMLDMVEDFMDGMQLRYQRLDGSINALQKQKRIDEFNALDSPLFAFLLSTRSGGVGINLASADTVIILDPDFNPHQDIQALSRAHRIGQHKKVLCFQLVTRASAEERIMQMGRKKLALDHVLIQEMDADDADQSEMVSLLRHGATELFEDNSDQDIVYDNGSVDALLDRSHMEDTAQGKDKSAETQFSFARVWANNQGTLQDEMMLDNAAEQQGPDPGLWANILQERERIATEDAKLKAEAYGRGRRARGAIDYGNEQGAFEGIDLPEVKIGKAKEGDDSDTDFLAGASGADDDVEDADPENLDNEHDALDSSDAKASVGNQKSADRFHPTYARDPVYKRAVLPAKRYILEGMPAPAEITTGGHQHLSNFTAITDGINCIACRTYHPPGQCPLKLAGVEYCNLCAMAHFGYSRVCPHIQSETQVRAMLDALKSSNEPEHLVAEAKKYLRGLKGNLVQDKKQRALKMQALREAQVAQQFQRGQGMAVWQN